MYATSFTVMEKEYSHEAVVASATKLSQLGNEEPIEDGLCHSIDKEAWLATCRVCQCFEPDRRGNIALGFLGISPLSCNFICRNEEVKPNLEVAFKTAENNYFDSSGLNGSGLVESVSPNGEVFVCTADLESGLEDSQDRLIELGCACKNDLGLAHYACALKWFINHGSTVCEICNSVAKNISTADLKKVLGSLKEHEALREKIVNREPNPAQPQSNYGVDPDAIAAIRRQRLSEISLWFNPHNTSNVISQAVSERGSTSNTVTEEVAPVENTATKWAVECTGILLATCMLTVTLAWFLAPRVGKKTAKNGLHILLGGVCTLTVMIFFRFFVLTRIKYGHARYWAILFVFWFLVFGIWASRTHGVHTT